MVSSGVCVSRTVVDSAVAQAVHVAQASPRPGHVEAQGKTSTSRWPRGVVWRNVLLMALVHLGAIYGALLLLTGKLHPASYIAFGLLHLVAGLGITAGAHRLWCHRCYKAKLPLRIFLAVGQTLAGENDIHEWSRDHRSHHKFSETDADPHNSNRGFFFSHVGWLLMRKHPDVIRKGVTIDLTDLLDDPVVFFQKKYYPYLAVLGVFILPTVVPVLCWGETVVNAYFAVTLTRYAMTLNLTWLVNSAAHMWGNRPYDRHIAPAENLWVTLGALGEGFHNYHHTFPMDYSTSEFMAFNFTTRFINLMAALGQATDRRKVNPDLIEKRKSRTGDGTTTWK